MSNIMSKAAIEPTLDHTRAELEALYEGTVEGIIVADSKTRRFLRVNRAICELLGYSADELCQLSVEDIHPKEDLPEIRRTFEAMRQDHRTATYNVPCVRKDGGIVRVDVTANHIAGDNRDRIIGFFRDVTERNRALELLKSSENRYQLIAANVSDIIWTTPIKLSREEKAKLKTDIASVVDDIMQRWRFSFISPAVERVYGYTLDESIAMSLRAMTTPASFAVIREKLIAHFASESDDDKDPKQHVFEAEFIARDGSFRWCEVVSVYLRGEDGLPTQIIGITRDISSRRTAERALRESESTLRSLFENLPDLVVTIDRDSNVRFINRGTSDASRDAIQGSLAITLVAPEHRQRCADELAQSFAANEPRTAVLQDIFGRWWSVRAVPLANEDGDQQAMVICTDVTQERLAYEAVNKEQRLLRQMLDLHERERQLMAYEIHDGFAQQLAGAIFRLQGFRDTLARDSAKAWKDFDSAVWLVGQAIGETRRLISGLRPPILDESGIIEAIDYLIYEHGKLGGPRIEFVHNVAFERLAPPLESALFRITQESLQNACRHSRSDRVRVEMTQVDSRILLNVRDWGVGFSPDTVEEQRFGLQGIRERVRLLDGHVVIESAPGKGTLISVELPLVDPTCGMTKLPL